MEVAERIKQVVEEIAIDELNSPISTSISMGFLNIDEKVRDIEDAIALADETLLSAKQPERNEIFHASLNPIQTT